VSALRSFFRFLNETGARAGDPADELVPPEVEERRVRYLTEDEYQRLRYAARHDPRDAAMIELLLQTGMRLSDLAGLRLGDLTLAPQSACTARVGSGRHRRIVRLTTKACEALRGYLSVRPADAGDDLVFQTKFHRGIGARAIEDVVNKYLRAAGIEDASVHDLRHTYAVHSLKRGVELEVVRDMFADADPLVASFWQVAASDTEALVDRMIDEHQRFVVKGGAVALERWDYWRSWVPRPGQSEQSRRADMAMKCLFLNRTTFSGILHGRAGPIGGRSQTSQYHIGCRFNAESLSERIRFVGHLYDRGRLLDVWCKDWQATLADIAEWYPHFIPDRVIAYLDPPYIEKSERLYARSFDASGGYSSRQSPDIEWLNGLNHLKLSAYLRTQMRFRWILSYDQVPQLLSDPALYASNRMNPSPLDRELLGIKAWLIRKRVVDVRYTASARGHGRRRAEELLITTVPMDPDFLT
jgi:DNA adenine methylase